MSSKQLISLIIIIVMSVNVLGQSAVPPISAGPNPTSGGGTSTSGTTSTSAPAPNPYTSLPIGVYEISLSRSPEQKKVKIGSIDVNAYVYNINQGEDAETINLASYSNKLYRVNDDSTTTEIENNRVDTYFVDISGNKFSVTQRSDNIFGSTTTISQILVDGKTSYEVKIGDKNLLFGDKEPQMNTLSFHSFFEANKDKVKMYIDGQEITGVSDDSKTFTLKDASTFYLLENGATARISKEGELRYTGPDGKAAVVEKDDLKKIFGKKETDILTLDTSQLSTFLSVAPIAKGYGYDITDLRVNADGAYHVDGEKDIYFSKDGKTIYRGEGILDEKGELVAGTSKTIIEFENGKIKSAQIPYELDGTKYTSVVGYRYNDKGEFIGYTVDDKNYNLDSNAPGFAFSENGNRRFNIERGFIEDKQPDGSWKECDTPECQALRAKIEAALDEKYQSEGKPTTDARKVQAIFKTIDFALTGFQGLQGFSQIFFSEEFLDEWRETVDEVFASAYLGTGYWTSALCATSPETDGANVAFLNPGPNGYLFPAAHIEVERSSAIEAVTPAGQSVTKYLYKIAFSVLNPKDKPELHVNVKVTGDRTINLYSAPLTVKDGKTLSRSGPTAIVQYSEFLYRKACVTFDPSIDTSNGQITELCTTISESSSPSTPFINPNAPVPGSTPASGSTEPTINQI